MDITLEIEFAGMCMFVPAPNGDAMHVLLPHGHGKHHGPTGGQHAMPPHIVLFAYDRAHTGPGNPQPSKRYEHELLPAGLKLVVGGGSTTKPDTRLQESKVMRLDEATGFGGVDPDCVTADAGHFVTARLELRSGGATSYHGDGKRYCLGMDRRLRRAPGLPGDRCQELSEFLVWRVGTFQSENDPNGRPRLRLASALAFETLQGQPVNKPLPSLYPVDGRVRLLAWHVVEAVKPNGNGEFPDLTKLPSSDHFGAYYTLERKTGVTPSLAPPTGLQIVTPSVICGLAMSEFAP